MLKTFGLLALSLTVTVGLAACGGTDVSYDYPTYETKEGKPSYKPDPGLFGSDGLVLFGGDDKKGLDNGSGGGGIGVNAFLWRASLDTLSFMPIASADPFGGVILTDWYAPPETPEERFKVNLFILSRDLRADGIRITVFRQVRRDGAWVDADVAAKTTTDLENAVLARARQLRIAQSGSSAAS